MTFKGVQQLSLKTLSSCKESCLNTTSFKCSATVYSIEDNTCQLYNQSLKLIMSNLTNFKGRSFSSVKQTCINNNDTGCFMEDFLNKETMTPSQKLMEATSLYKCKMLCFTETSFICTAISFLSDRKTCKLYKTRNEKTLSSSIEASGSIFSIKRCVNINGLLKRFYILKHFTN